MKYKVRWVQLVLLLILLSALALGGCGTNYSPTKLCTEDEVKTVISWSGGIVLTLNHCTVRDILSSSAAATALSTLIAEDCPNILCKAAAAGIVAFLVSQTIELQDVDNLCGNQGAILEVGSFKDKTIWQIRPICETKSGYLVITSSNQNRGSNLKCDAIYLSFTLQNIGEQAMKWHLAIFYGKKVNVQPRSLHAYLQEDGTVIRTGMRSGMYDEEGIVSDQGVTVVVTGNIDPQMVRKYGQVTLRYFGIAGNVQSPASFTVKCS